MGKVITINAKNQFDENLDERQKVSSIIEMNGLKEPYETVLYAKNQNIGDYKVFNIEFLKKYNVIGRVNGERFNSILKEFIIPTLACGEKKFVLTLAAVKGNVARAALKKLYPTTKVKCSPVSVDLIKAIPSIIRNVNNATVNSGWFSKLGTQLRNALLQGEEVDENDDWKKFVDTDGSELKNVEFRIVNDDYEKGYILISVSARGFIFTKSIINDTKLIIITDKIIEAMDDGGAITFEGISNADDEEEIETLLVEEEGDIDETEFDDIHYVGIG